MYSVYVRAKTSDNRWATVNAIDLEERSFRSLILETLVKQNRLGAIVEDKVLVYRTPLTKEEAEAT